MSETPPITEYGHMTCEDCDAPVRVDSKTATGLQLTCQCTSRSIKVKRAIPFGWSE
jgi:hypothetical protein